MGLWGLLLTRTAYLQFLPNEKLNTLQARQFQTVVTLPSRRGNIIDTNGKDLAMSSPAYSIYADPKIIENKKQVAQVLSKYLNEPASKIVAISLIDDYGTLIYSKFLNQIESCLNIGVSASINHNRQRGAGIGSSIIFNAIDSLYLGCIAGKKTRVTAIIPFGISDKIQEKLQKSIFLI